MIDSNFYWKKKKKKNNKKGKKHFEHHKCSSAEVVTNLLLSCERTFPKSLQSGRRQNLLHDPVDKWSLDTLRPDLFFFFFVVVVVVVVVVVAVVVVVVVVITINFVSSTLTLTGAWRDRDLNDIFAHCALVLYFFYLKFSNYICPSDLHPWIFFNSFGKMSSTTICRDTSMVVVVSFQLSWSSVLLQVFFPLFFFLCLL